VAEGGLGSSLSLGSGIGSSSSSSSSSSSASGKKAALKAYVAGNAEFLGNIEIFVRDGLYSVGYVSSTGPVKWRPYRIPPAKAVPSLFNTGSAVLDALPIDDSDMPEEPAVISDSEKANALSTQERERCKVAREIDYVEPFSLFTGFAAEKKLVSCDMTDCLESGEGKDFDVCRDCTRKLCKEHSQLPVSVHCPVEQKKCWMWREQQKAEKAKIKAEEEPEEEKEGHDDDDDDDDDDGENHNHIQIDDFDDDGDKHIQIEESEGDEDDDGDNHIQIEESEDDNPAALRKDRDDGKVEKR
ncbi:hypothetical protein HSX11_22350, partial [Oxalobacteraceae bacterium]|nr:hypothetical protein [Oxalobacteraceae bacterium]